MSLARNHERCDEESQPSGSERSGGVGCQQQGDRHIYFRVGIAISRNEEIYYALLRVGWLPEQHTQDPPFLSLGA